MSVVTKVGAKCPALILLIVALFGCGPTVHEGAKRVLKAGEDSFQHDADIARLEHLQYWTGLIEKYEEQTGRFPFAEQLTGATSTGLVRIATKQQADYFTQDSGRYLSQLDINQTGRFLEFSVSEFVKVIEMGLQREIEEKYDIQYVPTQGPNWYHYFVTRDGYVLWTICRSCGVSRISTLLMDGSVATLNIASTGMKGAVTKALTREEMLADPLFREWISERYIKEAFVREREALHVSESKRED